MADDALAIKLTRDQALMLSGWLDRMIGSPRFDDLVNEERAVWSPLYAIAGTLDRALVEIVMPDYSERLQAARGRLLDSLGEVGSHRPPSSDALTD
ncbi:hypothetical protein [Cryptosporangium japonicum]|uniref:Uncharacterized protein n=1 Tax=Cryptosporangium japonicum TaxID=80872 RepID=A0ABN0THM8_9ACTN